MHWNSQALLVESSRGIRLQRVNMTARDMSPSKVIYQLGIAQAEQNLTKDKDIYDLPDDTGLAIEYLIVCLYIVLSYLAAYKAYILHMQQRTRTDFKTNVNLSFVIFFLVWASGNLLYTILISAALTDTNFFYIKSVLTLTYFLTYLGFTLIVHYRYRLIFSLFKIPRHC
jgi:hypothetical protein